MRSFIAFLKKEFLESWRTCKLLILAILFFVFGIMNPAVAKLTPWLMEFLSEELAESGMAMTSVAVDALTSWTQFFKNIPMALIVFVCLYGNIFTREYSKETLILILTKGMARHKIVLAKTLLLLSVWTVGYWLCFVITHLCNAYFWDNSIAQSLVPAGVYWWLFGVFVLALMIFFSVATSHFSGVLLGTGGVVLGFYLLSLIPKLTDYMPTTLMNGMSVLMGAVEAQKLLACAIITALASIGLIVSGIFIFNKKQLS